MPGSARRRINTTVVGHRLAFATVGTLILFTAVLLPFAVAGVFADLLSPPSERVYRLIAAQAPNPTHLHLLLDVMSVDDGSRTASIRVSGHQVCPGPCSEAYKVLFVSLIPEGSSTEGLPPFATVKIPDAANEVTETITLPVRGDPIRYPFDDYTLGMGFVLQRVLADGSVRSLSPEEAAGRLILNLQTSVQRADMSAPTRVDLGRITVAGGNYPFLAPVEVSFVRPLYLRVLTVLLVLLITAAAAYAVFMRPLNELVTNVGALVLGVWGVRSILVGTNTVPGASAVDLSLSMIILFLLAAITVRALGFLDERSGFNLLGRVRRELSDHVPSKHAGTSTDTAASANGDQPAESGQPADSSARPRT